MKRKRWILALIAAGAAASIWAGWVRLGQAAGFGLVQPLPGIVPWHLDTAITLPVSVEAYGAYALGVWLAEEQVPGRAREFARWSAIGALLLGMTGQIFSHLLAAYHITRPPWPVVVVVSCVPVVAFGLAVALTHLLRSERKPGSAVAFPGPAAFPASRTSPPAASPLGRPSPQARTPARKPTGKVSDPGQVAAIRAMPGFPEVKPTQVRDMLHVRFGTAKELLAAAQSSNGHRPSVG